MTTKLDIEKIKKATEVLPERFISNTMYDKESDCYCWYGWIAKQLGHDPKPEYTTLTIKNVWVFLGQELLKADDFPTWLAVESDSVIRAYLGRPILVRAKMLEILENRNARD
jgi:hypothetical protein